MKLGLKFIRAVADAVGISSLPLSIAKGDASVAKAVKEAVPYLVSEPQVAKAGAVGKSILAKLCFGVSKLGCTNPALCIKAATLSSVAVGTAIVAVGIFIAFVGVVWVAKQVVKDLSEIIETMSGIHDIGEVAAELAAA